MNHWIREALRIQRIMQVSGWQLIYGIYRLSKLKGPTISVLGGKGAREEGRYSAQASRFATICVKQRYSVITGGGPGIMEAAHCGVRDVLKTSEEAKKYTLGFGVTGVDVGYKNPCAEVVNLSYYFVREWLLIRYAVGIAVFPGGIGTVDEFFSLLNLIKLNKLKPIPIVLIDIEYWKGIIDWYTLALEKEFIKPECKNLFMLTNDIDQAFAFLTAQRS